MTMPIDVNRDWLKTEVVKSILGKKEISTEELNSLEFIEEFSDGKSGSLVFEVCSFLPVIQIEGRSILKISKVKQWPDFIKEEIRYQNAGRLKELFAGLTLSGEIALKSTGGEQEIITYSFWKRAQDTQPLTKLFSVASLRNRPEMYPALFSTVKKLYQIINLDKFEAKLTFSEICKRVLGYRLHPSDGNIYSFINKHLSVSWKTPIFRWKGSDFPDPYYYSRESTSNIRRVIVGPIHGDLHSGNIFAAMGDQKTLDVCLIDAGLTSQYQILFYDQAYLEVSELINSSISDITEENLWPELFNHLTKDIFFDKDKSIGNTIYDPILKEIHSIREPLQDLIKSNSGWSYEIQQQYRIQQICAGLNFCNKNFSEIDTVTEKTNTLSKNKFAYIYAAYQLKHYLAEYGDDQETIQLKESISKNSNFLFEQELSYRKEFEDVWKAQDNLATERKISVSQTIANYDRIKTLRPFNRFPTYSAQQYASSFPNWTFLKIFNDCQSIEEKVILFGMLAASLKTNLIHLSAAFSGDATETFNEYKAEFFTLHIDGIKDDLFYEWFNFIYVLLEDAIFNENNELFADYLLLAKKSFVDHEFSIYEIKNSIENQIFYIESFFEAFQQNTDSLVLKLGNWQAEINGSIEPEWLIKKAFLLSTTLLHDMRPCIEILDAGLNQLDRWPFQEQSYFLNAYLYIKQAFTVEDSNPKVNRNDLEVLKAKGFQDITHILKKTIFSRILKKPDSKEPTGYSIIYRDVHETYSNEINSLHALSLLLQSGFMPHIWYLSLVNRDEWAELNNHVFNHYPRLCYFYSYQYLLNDFVDAKWLREQIKSYLLPLKNGEINRYFFAQISKVYSYTKKIRDRHNLLSLALMSEFLEYLPYQDWTEIFQEVWTSFNSDELKEILYSVRRLGPTVFVESALGLLDDIKQIHTCLAVCLTPSNDTDEESIKLGFLYHLHDNPKLISVEIDQNLEELIQITIDEIKDKNKSSFALKKLGNIDPILTPVQRHEIAKVVGTLEKLPAYKSTLRQLVYYTRASVQARAHLKQLILNMKTGVWPHGAYKDKSGHWSKAMFVDNVLPLHEQKVSPTNPNGLSWSKEEAVELFQYLSSSIDEFKTTPFLPKEAISNSKLFLNGLDFHLLKEMQYFLLDYKSFLDDQTRYNEILEQIQAGVRVHSPAKGTSGDLLVDNQNTVLTGIQTLRNYLIEHDFKFFSEYWLALLNKVLAQKEPHLLSSLNLLSYWLVYYRNEPVFKESLYPDLYLQILERYSNRLPNPKDAVEWLEPLVKISLVLNSWGMTTLAVRSFLELRTDSDLQKIRRVPDLNLLDTFGSGPGKKFETEPEVEFNAINEIDADLLQLTEFSIQGFKNYSSRPGMNIKLKKLNVLIGANGVGKSNIISFLEMLKAMSNSSISSVMNLLGGSEYILHYGSLVTKEILGMIKFNSLEAELSYDFSLALEQNNSIFFNSEKLSLKTKLSNPIEVSSKGFKTQSILSEVESTPICNLASKLISNIRIYDFSNLSLKNKFMVPSSIYDNKQLHQDFSNIGSILFDLKSSKPGIKYYQRIVNHIKQIYSNFKDFDFIMFDENQNVLFGWEESKTEYRFVPRQASEGILRFIALTTLLLQPPSTIPKVIVLDEPELCLHPEAIVSLNSMIISASQHSQIIVATQSPRLLNEFTPEDVIILEKPRGSDYTAAKRLNSEDLSNWLEDYSLSALWEKNVLGGKP